jgi:predicted oxidoreductase
MVFSLVALAMVVAAEAVAKNQSKLTKKRRPSRTFSFHLSPEVIVVECPAHLDARAQNPT